MATRTSSARAIQIGRRPYAALSCLLALMGCGEPRIETSSEHDFWASIDVVREALDPGRRDQFDSALSTVSLHRLDIRTVVDGEFIGSAMQALNGLTGEEVISKADSIGAETEAQRRDRRDAEIRALVTRRDSAELISKRLDAFVVERSEFSVRSIRFERRPAIELTITNGLSEPVTRASFAARLTDPADGELLLEDVFDDRIPGGIGPGETKSWTITPDRLGPWGEVAYSAPREAVLHVTVRQLDGPDGQPLFGGVTWDADDQQRLKSLTASLSDGS